MTNIFPTGSFSTEGWTIASDPAVFNAWGSLPDATNKGGFSFAYDGIPTSTSKLKDFRAYFNRTLKRESKSKDETLILPASFAVNYANTRSTNSVTGGYFTESLYQGPNVGVNIGSQTVLSLGSSSASAGKQISGYGNLAGIRIGLQSNLGGEYNYDLNSGAITGGQAKDTLLGQAYGIGAAGIQNYGVIGLRGGDDSIQGVNKAPLGYGIINWGGIETGNNDDKIIGIGSLSGIYNYVDLAQQQKNPTILTGLGRDVITGQANAGNNGIVNNGFIGMGSGDDLFQSTTIGTDATNYFGGTGVVVMGRGNDVVQGFGTGTFYGDDFGFGDSKAAARSNQSSSRKTSPKNYDSLYLISGQEYVFTAISANDNKGQLISGFSITSQGQTMNVFGFDSFGTNIDNQQAIAAGTFSL